MRTDVLIVGAGPSGLTLANVLADSGVGFRIVDKKPGPVRESRAAVVHVRTLELLDKLGLAETAVERGVKLGRVELFERGGVIFFSLLADTEPLAKHREQGGRALFVRDGSIVLAEGGVETPLVDTPKLAIKDLDSQHWIVENILAAAGAAWAAGVGTDVIRAAIETFDYGAGNARKTA